MGNIVLNKAATSSSYMKPYAASNAANGSTAPISRWLSNTVPCWLKVDAGRMLLVNRWVVKHMGAALWQMPDYANSDFYFQGSNNEINWVNIDAVTNCSSSITDCVFTPVGYRYFRVYILKGLRINPRMASIVEFEVYQTYSSNLTNLKIGAGTLTPAFNYNLQDYTATVTCDNTIANVTPTTLSPTAVVKVNGATVTSGQPVPVALNFGSNTITVNITDGGVTQNYTITVTRLASNFLSGLAAQSGATNIPLVPVFNKATSGYTASVGFDTKSITVTPTAESSSATIIVNGIAVTSGQPSGPIQLNVGSNTITVAVTASNVTRNYTVTVTRADSAYLSSHIVQSGTKIIPHSPFPFIKTIMDHFALVDYDTDTVIVTPIAESSSAVITVNGTIVSSGSPSGPISLSVGDNFITVVVAASGGLSLGYSIKITRAGSSSLSALAANSGVTPITLSPSPFEKTTLEYTATVGYEVSSATVTPTAESASASITVNGSPVISGQASAPIALGIGVTEIPVVVTSDGVTSNYKITITRVDTSLSGLSLKGMLGNVPMALIPDFQSTIFIYTSSTSKGKVAVTPTTLATGATIQVNGMTVVSGSPSSPITLNASGSTTVPVTVTINNTITTYQIIVN